MENNQKSYRFIYNPHKWSVFIWSMKPVRNSLFSWTWKRIHCYLVSKECPENICLFFSRESIEIDAGWCRLFFSWGLIKIDDDGWCHLFFSRGLIEIDDGWCRLFFRGLFGLFGHRCIGCCCNSCEGRVELYLTMYRWRKSRIVPDNV